MSRFASDTLLDAVSTTGTITTDVMDITFLKGVFFGFKWTGTPTGAITVEISPDRTNWFTVNTISPAGSASSGYYNGDLNAQYVRAKYVHSSGSGTLTCYYSAKGSV